MSQEQPVKFQFAFPVTMSPSSSGRKASVMAHQLVTEGGRAADARKAHELITSMVDRTTVRWSDLLRLDKLLPGTISIASAMCGVDNSVLKRACNDGGVDTAPFIYLLGMELEQLLIAKIGRFKAMRRIMSAVMRGAA